MHLKSYKVDFMKKDLTQLLTSVIDSIMTVKEIREKLGLTQEKFASRLGISFVTVSRWEKGKASPSPLAQEKLSRLENQINKENRVIIS